MVIFYVCITNYQHTFLIPKYHYVFDFTHYLRLNKLTIRLSMVMISWFQLQTDFTLSILILFFNSEFQNNLFSRFEFENNKSKKSFVMVSKLTQPKYYVIMSVFLLAPTPIKVVWRRTARPRNCINPFSK